MKIAGRLARVRGRQAEAASLCLRAPNLMRRLVAMTQETRLGPFVTPQTFELAAGARTEALASGEREYQDGERFFTHFPASRPRESLAGRTVLDLGCGYGGRTVWYSERYETASIRGIEISAKMVERCCAFAKRRGVSDVHFEIGRAESLEFAEGAFDVVVSYDVLEHVEDPARSLLEIARVLRPGGEAFLVFPSYRGARASHLDYLTLVPGLHRIFDPDTTIGVVNEYLKADPTRYGVGLQPPARLTPMGRRALPTLNGMDRREAEALLRRAGLKVMWSCAEPLITEGAPVPFAAAATRSLRWLAAIQALPDLLIGHLAFHVQAA